jgi:hypothetical protein
MIKKNTENSVCHKAKDEEGVPYRTIARNVDCQLSECI